MTRSLHTPVTVPLWAALYAVHYGLARQSYASSDAADLLVQFWPMFPCHVQEMLRRDLDDPILPVLDGIRQRTAHLRPQPDEEDGLW